MAKVGLFFGSTTGHTEDAAVLIRQELNQFEAGLAQTFNVVRDPIERMNEFSYLILGTSTWDDGELQEDWRSLWFELDKVNLAGKKIAIYGLGDQITYPDSFQDALASMAAKIKTRGAELVGYWPADGYDFFHSTAVENGHFYGLALDNENQANLTPKRIKSWVQQVVQEFGLHNN
jgi:flavodoxin long chain